MPWAWVDLFDVPDRWFNLTRIDFYVKRIFGVHGDIHPVAFADTCEPCVFFEVEGKYYCMSEATMTLTRYGGAFIDPDDFLQRCASVECVVEEMEHYDEAWDQTRDEQADLYEKALRAVKRKLRKAGARARMVTAW